MAAIRKAGPFVNDGERRVIDELRRKLPPNAIIITNLYLPCQRDTLEVDAVVVAAFGVTLIEVKDWRGEVRFERDVCFRGSDQFPDPRPSISRKAKVMQSTIEAARPVAGVKIATNPLVIFASDSTRISGDIAQSVRVMRITEGVLAVAQGRAVEHSQKGALSDPEIVAVADAIHGQHDRKHRLRVGNYLLGERIPGSSFEEYWGAEASETDHKVRLKRHQIDDLAAESERDDQMRQAHRDKVALRKLERLRHRALPIVYSTFVDPDDDTSIWTAYEGVEGDDLFHASLTPKDKLAALAQVAEALEKCHGAGVLHRALSPECLLVPRGEKQVRIMHFDYARLEGKPTVAAGAVGVKLKKLVHAAPEVQRSPSSVSTASDVYSLGVTTAEILSGRHVDTQSELKEVVRKVRPKEIGALIFKMIEPEPKRRVAMGVVAEAFRREGR